MISCLFILFYFVILCFLWIEPFNAVCTVWVGLEALTYIRAILSLLTSLKQVSMFPYLNLFRGRSSAKLNIHLVCYLINKRKD